MIDKNTGLTLNHYKEPLKEIPSSLGYGYYGAILSNIEGTEIQCHVCGKLFASVQMHALQAHSLKASDYKDKFQLAKVTSLISEDQRQTSKMKTLRWWNNLSPEQKLSFHRNRRKKYREWRAHFEGRFQPKITLETKNKRGTCPDQLLDKIRKCSEEIGKSPTKVEFINFCGTQRYVHLIYKTFGSWDKAKEMLKLHIYEPGKTGNGGIRYTDEELLEYLQMFYQENRRPPTETDTRRGLIPQSIVYQRRFGGLPKARELAGIYEQPMGRWGNTK